MFIILCCPNHIFMGDIPTNVVNHLMYFQGYRRHLLVNRTDNIYQTMLEILKVHNIGVLYDNSKYVMIPFIEDNKLNKLSEDILNKADKKCPLLRQNSFVDFYNDMEEELSSLKDERNLTGSSIESKDKDKDKYNYSKPIKIKCITYQDFNDTYYRWCTTNDIPMNNRITEKTLFKSMPNTWGRGKESSTGKRLYFLLEDLPEEEVPISININ